MPLFRRNRPLQIAFLALAVLAVGAHGSSLSADDPTSIAGAGSGNWTTPKVGSDLDYARTAAPRYMIQEAPRPATTPATTYYGMDTALPTPAPRPGSALSTGPQWPSAQAPGAQGSWAAGSMAPVPAADVTELAAPEAFETYAEWPTDVTTETAPEVVVDPTPVPCDPPATVAPTRGRMVPCNPTGAYTGCGLPCMQGISEWHVRGMGGVALFAGDDPPEDCLYLGVDIGRTFCGCWGLDFYYRYNSGRFDREGFTDANGNPITKDGGSMHHVGLKVTMERGFDRNSRWYWWAGLGGGYFWTEDYIDDDEGAEVYGEAGIGYMINRNIRARVGVHVHGMDTKLGRKLQANFGDGRFLWVIALAGGLEFTF